MHKQEYTRSLRTMKRGWTHTLVVRFWRQIFSIRGRVTDHLAEAKGSDLVITSDDQKDDDLTGGKLGPEHVLSVHLEEYKSLRTEALSRVDAHGRLSNYAILLMGLSVPYATWVIQNQKFVGLLVPPLLFSSLFWLFLREDVSLLVLSAYTESELAPRIRGLPGFEDYDMLRWMHFLVRVNLEQGLLRQMFNRFLAFMRYGLCLIPAVTTLVIYGSTTPSGVFHEPKALTVFIVDTTLVAANFYAALKWVTQKGRKLVGEKVVRRIK